MLPLNPPVRVSSVFIGKTPLLSDSNNQMCLIKLESSKEMFSTKTYAIDKVTGDVYALKLKEETIERIDLQGYVEDEEPELETEPR